MLKSQQVKNNKICLQFDVKRRHFFRDRTYTLQLFPDVLTMAEKSKLSSPKYIFKIDLSFTIIWIVNQQGKLEGFTFPYQKKFKHVYATIDDDGLNNLKTLLQGRVFFCGSNFKRYYSLQGEIAQGQFGKVFKCQDISKTIYAVKLIDKEATLKLKNGIDTLINEIMIMQRMDHPNIIKMHEVYQDEINFYIVMDYINGVSLRQDLQNQKDCSQQRASKLFKQLIHAVAYLHGRGVIHRDLKPSNIMIKSDKLTIIDFGLSCFQGEQLRILPDCGTIGYMAPELFKKIKCYDSKVDIFSVACIYYRILTGLQAFQGKTDDDTIKLNKAARVDLVPYLHKGSSSQPFELLVHLFENNPEFRLSAEETITIMETPQLSVKEQIGRLRGQQIKCERSVSENERLTVSNQKKETDLNQKQKSQIHAQEKSQERMKRLSQEMNNKSAISQVDQSIPSIKSKFIDVQTKPPMSQPPISQFKKQLRALQKK